MSTCSHTCERIAKNPLGGGDFAHRLGEEQVSDLCTRQQNAIRNAVPDEAEYCQLTCVGKKMLGA